MFWRFGGYANISSLDSILDKPDVTVEELLDESDLIQELKQQNSKLIEYLRDENVLERLLRYVVTPKEALSPDDDSSQGSIASKSEGEKSSEGFFGKVTGRSRAKSVSKSDLGDGEESKEEKQRLKYAFVACEILSSEVWSISEALLDNLDSLRTFWQYIKQPAPTDPIQAGYFTKVNEALLDRKTNEMLALIKSIDNVVPDMLQHVDCPTIMDLLLKIISLEKADGGQGIVDWLQSNNFIPILLSYLTPEHCSSTQTSAGDFLKAIITISANATTQDQSVIGPNELTRQLVSEPCVKSLIDVMLQGGNPLTVGVGIVIEVIRKNNSDYDLENQIGPVPKSSDPIYLGTLLRQFANRIPNFMDLVHISNRSIADSNDAETGRKRELKVAFGATIEPLGFDRFKTCELMAELLHCSNMGLLNERGSEAEVARRDAERERLKAEGKLQFARDSPSPHNFGTSVDSHGFHHARPPSSEFSEETKKLEVQNSTEDDEFENVVVPDKDSETSRHAYQAQELKQPPESSFKNVLDTTEEEEDIMLQELEDTAITTSNPEHNVTLTEKSADEANPAEHKSSFIHADSPVSSALSAQVGGLELETDSHNPRSPQHQATDDHKISSSSTTESSSKSSLSLLTDSLNQSAGSAEGKPEEQIPNTEDKPAPLFSWKHDKTSQEEKQSTSPSSNSQNIESDLRETSDGERDLKKSPPFSSGEMRDFVAPYEVDLDGSPVVGDLLKMQFVEHKVVPTILDFFFRFPWNNFLHNVVYDVVQQVFNGPMDRGFNRSLAIDLFETGAITDRIIEGQRASDDAQRQSNMRLGYMGHLTLIAEEVLKFTERHPPELLSPSILEKVVGQPWMEYVEHTLAETRERDNAILGGVRPDMSVGPRQAVLNAVNAAAGFGNTSLVSAGLSGNGAVGLDNMDLGGTGGSYGASGATLLSGFNNSSDEEDEEMDDGDPEREKERQSHGQLGDEDQSSLAGESQSVPPPLQIPPSRARRQFAARLAQRKAAIEAANREQGALELRDHQSEEGLESPDEGKQVNDSEQASIMEVAKPAEEKGPERFSSLFSGHSSDDENDDDTLDMGHDASDQ